MTPARAAYHRRVMAKAATLEPDMAAAMLRAWRALAASFTDAELAALLATRSIEGLISEVLNAAALAGAFAPVQQELRRDIEAGVRYFARTLPVAARPMGGAIAFGFDLLNPRVLDAIRTLETRVLTTLATNVRETVRQAATEGLALGLHPREVARGLRDAIPLAPNQEAAVRNFRRMLEAGDRAALTRALRDHRFDATLAKALGKGAAGLSSEQIDRMVAAYNRRMISYNAETLARTATLDSLKLGQRLTWAAAVERGDVDGARLRRRWSGVRDSRERPEHWEMDRRADAGEAPGMGEPYSNGEMIPGETTYNCRCLDSWFLARAA